MGGSIESLQSQPGLVLHTAEAVLPMGGCPPIRDGGVLVDRTGTIVQVGCIDTMPGWDERRHHQILLPGLINAHIHATDAGVPEPLQGGDGLVNWVERLLEYRARPVTRSSDTLAATLHLIDAMASVGTVAVGEVSNDLETCAAFRSSGFRCRYMHEALAWQTIRAPIVMESMANACDARYWDDTVAHAYAMHAPYSVSATLALALQRASERNSTNLYIHLAEDQDERRLYVTGDGPWAEFLKRAGVWDPGWSAPGMAPIAYFDQIGLIDNRLVAVHLAGATRSEIAVLARRGARAILSPRSNLHITGLFPDVRSMVRCGLEFAFGTDGRGSNSSVDLLAEASQVAARFPDLPPGVLLEGATWGGARILGFADMGRLRTGRRPGIVSIITGTTPADYRSLEKAILFDRRQVALIEHPGTT